MHRLTLLLGALSIGSVAIPAASAATIIGTGAYMTGDYLSFTTPYTAPHDGTYRFEIDLTTPVSLDAYALQIVTTTFFYDFHDGMGFQYAGGDDAPGGVTFQEITPTKFVAFLPTTAFTSVTTYGDPLTGPDERYDTFESCCSVDIEAREAAPADGTYTISVSSVPEPESWAMMILGFGVVGGALRAVRRRTAVRLRFA